MNKPTYYYDEFEDACYRNDENQIKEMTKDYSVWRLWKYGLHGACKGGHIALAEALLTARGLHSHGLWGACKGNQYEMARWIINKARINNIVFESGDIDEALWWACESCVGEDYRLIKLILEMGADLLCGLQAALELPNISSICCLIESCEIDLQILYKCTYKDRTNKVIDSLYNNDQNYDTKRNCSLTSFLIWSIKLAGLAEYNNTITKWNGGLIWACLAQNVQMIKLMIKKGARLVSTDCFYKYDYPFVSRKTYKYAHYVLIAGEYETSKIITNFENKGFHLNKLHHAKYKHTLMCLMFKKHSEKCKCKYTSNNYFSDNYFFTFSRKTQQSRLYNILDNFSTSKDLNIFVLKWVGFVD